MQALCIAVGIAAGMQPILGYTMAADNLNESGRHGRAYGHPKNRQWESL